MIDKIYEIYLRNVKYVLVAIPTLLFAVMAYLYIKSS